MRFNTLSFIHAVYVFPLLKSELQSLMVCSGLYSVQSPEYLVATHFTSKVTLPILRMRQCKMLFSCCRGGLWHRCAKDHPDGSFSALWDGADWGPVQIHLHGCAALHRNVAETHRGGTGVQQKTFNHFRSFFFLLPSLTLVCFLYHRKVRLKGVSTPTLSTPCLTWLEENRALYLLALLFLLQHAQSK